MTIGVLSLGSNENLTKLGNAGACQAVVDILAEHGKSQAGIAEMVCLFNIQRFPFCGT